MKPIRPQCRHHARPASYLFVWSYLRSGKETTDTEPMCQRCGSAYLSQSALPGGVVAIAVWDRARAESGWYWH